MKSCKCGLHHVWAEIRGSYCILVCDYCKVEDSTNTKDGYDAWFKTHNHPGLGCAKDKNG